MDRVYIGLGGNLGGPGKSIRGALDKMEAEGLCRVLQVSSFYSTEPVGIKDQPWFINAAAIIETDFSPAELIKAFARIERDFGRPEERIKNGPRPLDIDILLWEDRVIKDNGLVIPHPGMRKRRFVLEPLSEIAPDIRHPETGETAAQMLSALDDPSAVRKA